MSSWRRLIDEYLYGIDHPYGNYSSAAAFDALTREQLLDFYKTVLCGGQMHHLYSRKNSPGILPLLNQHFAIFPLTSSRPCLKSSTN